VSRPAAILDIDGTLVDTNYHHAIAWYRAFLQSGVTLPLWKVHRHIGMGGDQLVASLAGEDFDAEHGDDVRAAEEALYMGLLRGGRAGRDRDRRRAHPEGSARPSCGRRARPASSDPCATYAQKSGAPRWVEAVCYR
jgi:phosphoglycolate phosphatase-like HAD superfamily hydrolase